MQLRTPLERDRPVPMLEQVPAVHGLVYVKAPLVTDNPEPRLVTVVVCHPWLAVVNKVPEVGRVRDVVPESVTVKP